MANKIPHEEILKYFQTEQWQQLLRCLRGQGPEEFYHSHIYIDTSLRPDTLRQLLFTYFEAIGMPLNRPVDFQASNVGHDMLHNIHPSGAQFHVDLAWRLNQNVILAPMPPEVTFQGSNLDFWGKSETYAFFDQFPLKKDVPPEEVDQYFHTSQWDEIRHFVRDKSLVHFHANIETSVHPDLIRDAALRALKREGWVLQKDVHCIFFPRKDWKAAKICLLMSDPMFNFDIAWTFNPDVVIRPSEKFFIRQIRPDFDLRYEEPLADTLKKGIFQPDISADEMRQIGRELAATV